MTPRSIQREHEARKKKMTCLRRFGLRSPVTQKIIQTKIATYLCRGTGHRYTYTYGSFPRMSSQNPMRTHAAVMLGSKIFSETASSLDYTHGRFKSDQRSDGLGIAHGEMEYCFGKTQASFRR